MSPTPLTGDELLAIARIADARCAGDPDGALLRVRATYPDRDSVSCASLRGVHPFAALAGYVAPPTWRALGVTAHGLAVGPAGTDDVVVTVVVGRDGSGASLLRRGDELTPLPGRSDGLVADACRRALGLPTAPPPASTLGLWTLCWLDRVVAAAISGDRADLSWAAVARHHPACGGPISPTALAAAAVALADAWPWDKLRASPEIIDVPGKPSLAEMATWMDDGLWARWVLAAFPALGDLVDACRAVLPAVVADAVELVVAGNDRWSGWA